MMFELVGQLVEAQEAIANEKLQIEQLIGSPLASSLNTKQLKAEICPIVVLEKGVDYCTSKRSLARFDALASEVQFLIAEVIGTSQFFDKIMTALDQMRGTLNHASDNYRATESEILVNLEDRIHDDVLSRVGQLPRSIYINAVESRRSDGDQSKFRQTLQVLFRNPHLVDDQNLCILSPDRDIRWIRPIVHGHFSKRLDWRPWIVARIQRIAVKHNDLHTVHP